MLPRTTSAPTSSSSADDRCRTAPLVPTGMKHGVENPRRGDGAGRAVPWVASTEKPSVTSATSTASGSDATSIASRTEPVALGQRQCVQLPPAGTDQGVDEDQQRRPGQVEVGEQHIRRPPGPGPVDEQLGAPVQFSRCGRELEARTLVVPMAITRPPVARACSQAARVLAGTM